MALGVRETDMFLNRDKLRNADTAGLVDVTSSNVFLGATVRRGRHWNSRWRDDVDKGSEMRPKLRVYGRVVGFTNESGLVGQNSGRPFDADRITPDTPSGWAVVEWSSGVRSVYPIGYDATFSLAMVA